ncbi:MAG: hypothetical protein ACFB9M_09280 [Myxococcota bacterium]
MTELHPADEEAARQSLEHSLDLIHTALHGPNSPDSQDSFLTSSEPMRADSQSEFLLSIAQTVLGRGQALTAILQADSAKDLDHLMQRQSSGPAAIDLGFTDNAYHWLAPEPPELPDHTQANASGNPSAMRAFAQRARAEWNRLLAERSEQMPSSSHLLAVCLARNASDHFLGWNGRDVSIHDMLHRTWRRLHLEGRFDKETYRSATFQSYYLSEEELRQPLEVKTAGARRSGLRLAAMRIQTIKCPHRRRYERSRKLEVFASGLTAAVHAWSYETFSRALRHHPEHDAILRDLYHSFADLIRERPHRFSMDYVKAYLLIRKEA